MKIKRIFTIVVVSLVTLVMVGCTTPSGAPNHAGTGAIVGGVGGAGLGAVIAHHNPGAGLLFGGALGAITGALIGSSMDQPVYAAAPPPPPPSPRYVWVSGRWVWNGAAWIWEPGHWAVTP